MRSLGRQRAFDRTLSGKEKVRFNFSLNFIFWAFTLTSWFVLLRVGAEKASLVPGTKVELVVIVSGGLAGQIIRINIY